MRLGRFLFLMTALAERTNDKAQLLVVAGVHGLALLEAAAVVGLALHVEGDPPQLEDDVPLSLRGGQTATRENLLGGIHRWFGLISAA